MAKRAERENQGHDEAVEARAHSDRLSALLEGAALTGSEARVLVGMISLRAAGLKQLAAASGISRSNLYPVLEALRAKGLADRLPGNHAVWTSPGPDKVVARLNELEEHRLTAAHDQTRQRLQEASSLLAALDTSSGADRAVLRVMEIARAGAIYDESMASVRHELLVTNRGPYAGEIAPSEAVLDAVARGVRVRALYQEDELAGSDGPAIRDTADAYAAAGIEQRVVDELPVLLAVFDRSLAFIGLAGPKGSDPGFPTAAICGDPGVAETLARGFEDFWRTARPYEQVGTRQPRRRRPGTTGAPSAAGSTGNGQ